jgi:hypothetical protein
MSGEMELKTLEEIQNFTYAQLKTYFASFGFNMPRFSNRNSMLRKIKSKEVSGEPFNFPFRVAILLLSSLKN